MSGRHPYDLGWPNYTCRLSSCDRDADPGELCEFHASPPEPRIPPGYEDRLTAYREAAKEG